MHAHIITISGIDVLYTKRIHLDMVVDGSQKIYGEYQGDLIFTNGITPGPWLNGDWDTLPEELHTQVPHVEHCLVCGNEIDECECECEE